MNKLINLIIMFFALYGSFPLVFSYLTQKNTMTMPLDLKLKLSFFILVFILQMIYKMLIRSIASKKINFGELFQNSLLNALLYLTGLLIYLDLVEPVNKLIPFFTSETKFVLQNALIVATLPNIIYMVGKTFLKPH